MNKTIAPFGSWKSPITADLITAKTISLVETCADGDDIYWSELRPLEQGRYVIIRRTPDGTIAECTPPDFSARTMVHEYGGGAFTVHKGVIYFCNFKDQHLYRQAVNGASSGAPELLTPQDGYRYADLVLDEKRNRIICIREDHTGEGEAVNTIVSISLQGNDNGTILVQGNNFYSSPRLSPDGNRLAWLTWNHPNMPWDGTELWVADVREDGTLQNADLVTGSASESIFQPEWSPAGVLHFVAEHTGWWNLYRWQDSQAEALHPMEAEFGEPQWVFGMSTYAFVSMNKIVCAYTQSGLGSLAALDTDTKEFTPIQTPYTDIFDVHSGRGFVLFCAGSPTQPFAVVRMDAETMKMETIKQAFEVTVDGEYLSQAQSISFPTTNGKTAHAIYYAPKNKDYIAPQNERPPLMVISHGGPTSATGTALKYGIQYWTSRGFAVADINYRGSTGYGREYRQQLNGNWGIVDVDDCCNAALYLVQEGLADPNRLAIRGGSAGGYTTLACLAFRDVFKAGASHFGVSNLEALATDTHKFESRYLDSIIGPYPERKDLYDARSPINFTQNFNCPIILFQGDEDKVVPPDQSQLMFEAVRAREIPAAYVLFKGEQHGFRKAESIKRALEGELYFYSKIFKFDLAEEVEPVQIENL
ncbi:MAG TPA: S9 family peptidase [Anaerolineales bacterium]|nr:S9 family peptidase [Anaerolineales bacterium]